MPSHEELFGLRNNSPLRNRVTSAVIIAAEVVKNEPKDTPNHSNRLEWASAAFSSYIRETDRMFMAVLAVNKDATVVEILGLTDAAIDASVAGHINLFAGQKKGK